MNQKKVQYRWHRFSSTTLTRVGSYRRQPWAIKSTSPTGLILPTTIRTRGLTAFARRHPNETRSPCTIHSPNETRRGGACVPARTSAQRRFHNKNTRIMREGMNDECALDGATRAGTQAPPFIFSFDMFCCKQLAEQHGRAHRHRPYPSPSNHAWCALTPSGLYFR